MNKYLGLFNLVLLSTASSKLTLLVICKRKVVQMVAGSTKLIRQSNILDLEGETENTPNVS